MRRWIVGAQGMPSHPGRRSHTESSRFLAATVGRKPDGATWVPPGTDHGHLISFRICQGSGTNPPDDASMRRHGVRGLFVTCQDCGHERVVSIEGERADRLPGGAQR
jgi:hypothetical protein